MTLKNPRLDYPGHCPQVSQFPCFDSEECANTESKILIVTKELAESESFDPALNMYRLLTKHGVSVDIVCCTKGEVDRCKWGSSIGGANVIELPRSASVLNSPISEVLEASYHFNIWLTELDEKYSTVLSLDCSPILYYALLSRNLGMSHHLSKFVVFTRSSLHFDIVKSAKPIVSLKQINTIFVEREAIELADAVISNSQHYLNWLAEFEGGGDLQNCYFSEQPIFGSDLSGICEKVDSGVVKELVFIFTKDCSVELSFCIEAIKRLNRIEFKYRFVIPAKLARKHMKLLRTLGNISGLEMETVTRAPELIDWESLIPRVGAFVFPNKEGINGVLYSYLASSGKPILTNDLEVRRKDPKLSIKTFIHNPEVIKEYLLEIITKIGETKIESPLQSDLSWMRIFGSVPNKAGNGNFSKPPDVTVCISHHNRGDLLLRAITSVMQQTYSCAEIIVVDDGSTDARAIEVLSTVEGLSSSQTSVRLIRQKNLFIGASRNKGLFAARGEYLLFMDDDNEAKPNELEVFVKCALNTNADILSCLSEVFSGSTPGESSLRNQHALFVGPSVASGLVSNPFGDSNMFVKVSSARAIGGFSEYYRVGRDDQEFFLRAKMEGLAVQLIPMALYYYRLNKNRIRDLHINSYSGHARVMQAYANSKGLTSSIIAGYAQGLGYAVGPWGPSLAITGIRLRVIEFFRIYAARFPAIYAMAEKIKKLLLS